MDEENWTFRCKDCRSTELYVEHEYSITEEILGEVATCEKGRFTYEYDFGDSWEHTIQGEKILLLEPGVQYSLCSARIWQRGT